MKRMHEKAPIVADKLVRQELDRVTPILCQDIEKLNV